MRKVLVLSCGSFFESQMTEMLKGYVSYVTNGNNELISFLELQAQSVAIKHWRSTILPHFDKYLFIIYIPLIRVGRNFY